MLPGVSIGHNEFGAGPHDLRIGHRGPLRMQTNPANPNQMQCRGAWEDMRVIRTPFLVKGAGACRGRSKVHAAWPGFTERGRRTSQGVARCGRRGWKPARRRISQACGWIRRGRGKRVRARRARSAASRQENMGWADRQGNIGYQAVAITPLRPNWSELVPGARRQALRSGTASCRSTRCRTR